MSPTSPVVAGSFFWSRRWSWRWTLLFLAVASFHLWVQARLYSPFFADDSFISLRYTERLLHGQGLTWDDYERVEGYSNLLWVLLCAIPGLLGMNLVVGARLLGHVSLTAAFAALLFVARPRELRDGLAPLLASLALAATDAVAAWAWGGLENPLVVACLLWGIACGLRATEEDAPHWWGWTTALVFGLSSWTRPDSPLFAFAVAVPLALLAGRRGRRSAAYILGGALFFMALQLTFRWFYYRDLFPNTYYAKFVLNEHRTQQGLDYLRLSLAPLAWAWLSIVSALWLVRRRATRALGTIVLIGALGWTSYVVRIGGDIFPAWRHFLPIAGLGALALSIWLAQHIRAGAMLAATQLGVLAIGLALVGHEADKRNWAKEETWEWDGAPVARLLRLSFADEKPLLAVDPAGSIPYFSRLPSLDLMGLSDRYLAHHRPATMGQNMLGHELGDAGYYAKRNPDIVCFGIPPCFRESQFPAQQAFSRSADFRKRYELVVLEARAGKRPLLGELWFRRDGKIGVRHSADEIEVPGYLLGGSRESPIVGEQGGLALRLAPRRSERIDELSVGAGVWHVEVESSEPLARVVVHERRTRLVEGRDVRDVQFELKESALLGLELGARESGAVVRKVVLRRL